MKIFIYCIIGIVSIAIIAGFFVVGSPKEQRLRQFDEQRVQHLQNIQYEIVNYWQSKETLPETLSDLNDAIRGFIVPKDPETQTDYEYSIVPNNKPVAIGKKPNPSFELCATFNRPSEGTDVSGRYPSKPLPAYPQDFIEGDGIQNVWGHATGRVCFERTIDPDRYPPFSKIKN